MLLKNRLSIKLCGINNINIVDYCCTANYQPDFLGFIFYPPSPRNIAYETAKKYKKIINNSKINKVAVTVNPSKKELIKIFSNLEPQYLQLHGEDTKSLLAIKELKDKFSFKLIKALPIGNINDLKKTDSYVNIADYFLFDTVTSTYGGSGKVFDWDILKHHNITKPYFLSGGININNIAQAISSTDSKFIDICSGIESSKGVKDINKIKEILKYIKTNA